MASNAIALRMKYRKHDAQKLEEIINNEKSSEIEVKVAQEFLDKLNAKAGDEPVKEAPKKTPAKKADKKATPKKSTKEVEVEEEEADGTPESASKRQNKKTSSYQSEEQLTPEEEARLAAAEAEYDKRQGNRKTPSKSDKGMKDKKSSKSDRAPRETKRQSLETSEEIPGMKIGSKVKLKGDDNVGEVTRLYKSGDGKEKCMVKFAEGKPIKKRITALELAEDVKPAAPAKKTPKKK